MPPRKVISKVLVANRGEIALRVLRTCRRLGIQTVVAHSVVDRDAPFVRYADSAICIGDSYLNQDAIFAAAKKSGADAIHPGYGFLSENASFSARCEKEGISFIGPSAASIEAMGSKAAAKKLLTSPQYLGKVPVIPGYNGDDQSLENLTKQAKNVGFPLLIKASAGGGGKGMRIVHNPEDVASEIESAKREAKASFGDDSVLLERYFGSVKHIEFQIFGDSQGNVVHLYERDCSVQRRYQKIIEETPSVALDDALRTKMGAAAVVIGEAIRYCNAGTVEFILDQQTRQFYFLEVNTRLQVEHPITEAITGLDLVEVQLRVAEGWSLPELGLLSGKVPRRGHAIECRLYCEDPNNNFMPSVGLLEWFKPPTDIAGSRFDSGVQSGSEITVFYDPMVSKVICHAPTRGEAVAKMIRILSEMIVYGPTLTTNLPFLVQILKHKEFVAGQYTTHMIADHISEDDRKKFVAVSEHSQTHLLTVSLLMDWYVRHEHRQLLRHVSSGFRNNPSRNQFQNLQFQNNAVRVEYLSVPLTHKQQLEIYGTQRELFHFQVWPTPGQGPVTAFLHIRTGDLTENVCGSVQGQVQVTIDNFTAVFSVLHSERHSQVFVHHPEIGGHIIKIKPRLIVKSADEDDAAAGGLYKAPMSGKISKIVVTKGATVKSGTALIIMESMKMETKINAKEAGVVEAIFVKEGDIVQDGQPLVKLTQPDSSANS